MNKVKRVTHNSESTIFCIPKPEGRKLAICFTLFSAIDAQEWQYVMNKMNRSQVVKIVEQRSVTAEIYGVSIFEFFDEHPSLVNAIKDQIENQHLEPYTTA